MCSLFFFFSFSHFPGETRVFLVFSHECKDEMESGVSDTN